MRHNYATPLVVKYGGAALEGALGVTDPVFAELAALHAAGQRFVLVHGGGPEIDRALAARGIETRRVAGQRVTDEATLETVEAVLCGSLNKRLVRSALALGIPAAGVSGQDAKLLVAERARGDGGADLGFVGEIVACSPALLLSLLEAGFVPVVAPLAVSANGTQRYNVNADLAAAAIAAALRTDAFILVTNVPRVLRDVGDPSSGIDRLTPQEARAFSATDACRNSMKPKLLAAAVAVEGGAGAAYVCESRPGGTTIRRALDGDATIVRAS